MSPTCVIFDGPFADEDGYSGDEIPTWTVCLGDDNGDEVGKVYRFRSFGAALELAQKMARDRRIELVVEACRA